MTCPEIGNYGVTPEDVESRGVQVAGFIMRDRVADREQLARGRHACATTSSRNGIVAISDIDTRALTRLLRSAGVMRGVIAHRPTSNPDDLVDQARAIPQMEGADLVQGRHVRGGRSTGRCPASVATTATSSRRPASARRGRCASRPTTSA